MEVGVYRKGNGRYAGFIPFLHGTTAVFLAIGSLLFHFLPREVEKGSLFHLTGLPLLTSIILKQVSQYLEFWIKTITCKYGYIYLF